MDWKRLPRLDEDLVLYLREKFPPIQYTSDSSSEELARLMAVQSGRLDTIAAIEAIISLQKKGK
jgi:hypothetical protein